MPYEAINIVKQRIVYPKESHFILIDIVARTLFANELEKCMGKQTKPVDGKNAVMIDYVAEIMNSQSLEKVKPSVISLLDFMSRNEKYRQKLCEKLIKSIVEFGKAYLEPPPVSDKNVVMIPHEDAPLLMMLTYLSNTEDVSLIIEGLNRFVKRCDEFTEPQEEAISEEEIYFVLDAAQRKFKILDIIAHDRPLKILCLKNSHHECNCECGVSEHFGINEAIILVYHPKDISIFDRIYIFAHEIGHALHLALTKDVDIIPDGFDTFNEMLGMTNLTIKERQETFADAAAMAILNCDELKDHLPVGVLEQLLPYFDRYIEHVTSKYLTDLEDLPF